MNVITKFFLYFKIICLFFFTGQLDGAARQEHTTAPAVAAPAGVVKCLDSGYDTDKDIRSGNHDIKHDIKSEYKKHYSSDDDQEGDEGDFDKENAPVVPSDDDADDEEIRQITARIERAKAARAVTPEPLVKPVSETPSPTTASAAPASMYTKVTETVTAAPVAVIAPAAPAVPAVPVFSGYGLPPVDTKIFAPTTAEKVITVDYLLHLRSRIEFYPENIPTQEPDEDAEQYEARLSSFREEHATELAAQPDFKYLYDDFDAQMTKFARIIQHQHDACAWVGPKPNDKFYNLDDVNNHNRFETHVQKIRLPEKSRIIVIGDIHGGFHSLITNLEDLYSRKIIDKNFKILEPNRYIAFLGDIADRGFFAVESWYTIMRLKNTNPDRVITIRGNHEEPAQNSFDGFVDEACIKIGEKFQKVMAFYNLLPVASFLNNRMQLCHGGLDYCYDARPLKAEKASMACQSITSCTYNPREFFLTIPDELLGDIADAIMLATKNQAGFIIKNFLGWIRAEVESCRNLLNQIGEHIKFGDGGGDDDNIQKAITNFNTFADDCNNDDPDLENGLNGLLAQFADIINIIKTYEIPADSIIHGLELSYNLLSTNYAYYKSACAVEDRPPSPDRDLLEKSTLVRLLKTASCPENFRDTKLPEIMFMKETVGTPRAGIFEEFFAGRFERSRLENLFECGLAWSDFCTDAKGPVINFDRRFRYELGMALSHAIMRHQGLECVVRAHQHAGEMRDLLDEHIGFVELWDKRIGDIVPVRKGTVITLDVVCASGMREIQAGTCDTMTELVINNPDDITTWVMNKIHVMPKLSWGKELEDISKKVIAPSKTGALATVPAHVGPAAPPAPAPAKAAPAPKRV